MKREKLLEVLKHLGEELIEAKKEFTPSKVTSCEHDYGFHLFERIQFMGNVGSTKNKENYYGYIRKLLSGTNKYAIPSLFKKLLSINWVNLMSDFHFNIMWTNK